MWIRQWETSHSANGATVGDGQETRDALRGNPLMQHQKKKQRRKRIYKREIQNRENSNFATRKREE